MKRTDPDGTITYVPETPNEFDEIRDVTREEFRQFFGADPNYVSAEEIQLHRFTEPGYLPTGLVLTRFAVDENGTRVYSDNEAIRLRTLIRIRKDEV